MSILGPSAYPGSPSHIAMLFFCKFGPFLFSKDFWHSLYPWPSPLDSFPVAQEIAQGSDGKDFQPEDSGQDPSDSVRAWLGKWMKHIETWCFSVQSQNLQIHRNMMNMMVFGKRYDFFLNSFFRRIWQKGGKWRQGKKLNRIWGDPMKHTCTRCFVAIPVPHCIRLWIFMRFKIV